ncbi:MAG: NTF2 fold immunity protein [Bacteroidota bacterium]
MGRYLLSIVLLFGFISLCSQDQNESLLTAKKLLADYLQNSAIESYITEKGDLHIIRRAQVLKVLKEKLYQTYGWWNINKQRPFQLHFIDGYWVIFGTLSRNKVGGVFEAIYDTREKQIVYMTHGK